jgi:hypothetical protein
VCVCVCVCVCVQLLQNDWGSLSEAKVDAPIATTRVFASDRLLQAMSEPATASSSVTMSDVKAVLDRPEPADDLHSLVRTIWALEHSADFEAIARSDSPKAILAFWAQRLSAGVYAEMTKAAAALRYEELRKLIVSVLMP